MYGDFSMVIQGPTLDESRLDFKYEIEQYKSLFPEIILSTYTEHLNQGLIDFCRDHKIKIATQTIDIDEPLKIKYNVGYQVMTTLNGVRMASKPYVLKHRTDEKYSNLHKVLDKFLEDTEKWVTNSIFLISKHRYHFIMADHVICSKKEKMLKTFEMTLRDIYDNTYVKNSESEPASELTITRNFIRIHGDEPDMNRHDDQMCQYFNFINDTEMHPFMIRCNHGNMALTECHQLDPTLSGVHDLKTAMNRGGGW